MGVLPLQFNDGDSAQSLNLTGQEIFSIPDINNEIKVGDLIKVIASDDTKKIEFQVKLRIDTPVEIDYYRNGGILQTVLRRMLT